MNRSSSPHTVALVVTAVAVSACGGDDVDIITGRPAIPEAPSSTTIASTSPLSDLGAAGAVQVGSADGLLVVNETVLDPVELVASPDEPLTTGPIHAITDYDGGHLIAAANGLYYTHGERLVRSPASDVTVGLAVHSLDWDGIRLWLGTNDALYELSDGVLRRWLDELEAPVSAVRNVGGTVIAASGTTLYEIDVEDDSSDELDIELGTVSAIARSSDGVAYLASDRGIVSRSVDGGYTQYTLADGDDAVAAFAVDVQAGTGAVFATAIGVVKLGANGPEGLAPPPQDVTSALALDNNGDVWVAGGSSLTGMFVGTPPSFVGAVQPIVERHCVSCHATGSNAAPVIDFSNYQTSVDWSARMLARVTDAGRPMPPSAAEDRLSTDELDLMTRWYATGTSP